MPINNTKSPADYKAEFNQAIIGATVLLERAVQIRKNLAKLNPGTRISYINGPVGVAVSAAYNAVKAIKTFKGEYERNAAPVAPARGAAAAPARRF